MRAFYSVVPERQAHENERIIALSHAVIRYVHANKMIVTFAADVFAWIADAGMHTHLTASCALTCASGLCLTNPTRMPN